MTALVEVAGPQIPSVAPRRRTFSKLIRRPMGAIGLSMLTLAVLVAIFAPVLAPYDPYANVRVTIFDIYQPPSPAHPLGTDDGGKDVLSSLIYATRVSLLVGFTAAAITAVVGGLIGIVAGYRAGRTGTVLMSFTDFFLVIPEIALQIVIVAIAGQSLLNIILVIGLLGWSTTARLVRSQTLSVRERKFVLRAKAIGAGDRHILQKHVLPALLPLMIANTVLIVSLAILSESTLAFIGLGDPTVISWGQMLNFAFNRGAISAGAWWAYWPPGLAIVWVVLGHHAARDRAGGCAQPASQAPPPGAGARGDPPAAPAPVLELPTRPATASRRCSACAT